MKKFFQSKGFIVSSLALLCVTILGVCWFVSRDRTGDFRPDESPPSSVTGDWSDGGTQTDGDNGADAYAPGQSTDSEEEYQLLFCNFFSLRCNEIFFFPSRTISKRCNPAFFLQRVQRTI